MKKENSCIRLITLNTWKGDGLYSWRLHQMAQELFNLKPDVLFLQESVRTEDRKIDTTGFLAEFLGMESIYAPSRFKKREIEEASYDCHSGLAILSSGTIQDHWVDTLPAVPEDSERIALSAEVETDHISFIATNLHLTHLTGADALRRQQLFHVIEVNEKARQMSSWFCCGDFNFQVESDDLQSIEDETGVQIIDCYKEAGGILPAGTLLGENHRNSNKRVDYIFELTGEEKQHTVCTNGRIVLNEPDFSGAYASDHAAVMVDIIPNFNKASKY